MTSIMLLNNNLGRADKDSAPNVGAEITVEQMVSIIVRAYGDERKRRIARMFLGPPGVGKSMAVREAARIIAEKNGWEYSEGEVSKDVFGVIDLRASQLGEADVRGVPFPDHERRATRWMLPDFLPREGQGILFLDEVNLAPPHIQSQLYQLILDRRIGSYKLPDGWMVLAAGNREEDQAFVEEMAAPLRNRMAIYTVVPNLDAWLKWADEQGIDRRVIAYVRDSGRLYEPLFADRNFPSPRTWEFVSHHMDIYDEGMEEEWFATVVGLVGVDTALDFKEYLESNTYMTDKIIENWAQMGDGEKIKNVAILARAIARNPQIYEWAADTLEDEYHAMLLRELAKVDRALVLNIVREYHVPARIIRAAGGFADE